MDFASKLLFTVNSIMEDCCVVCAEPLAWLAYASCGHREVCSKCVARLRFVMQDKRCVICQPQSPAVVVTRNLGSFTSILPAAEFQQLRVGGCWPPQSQADALRVRYLSI